MSCWVVPSVAAELWGCSVESIQSAIRDGKLSTREDGGWTFVDMAPGSPTIDAPPKAVLPPTYTTVSKQELAALLSDGEGNGEGNGAGDGAGDAPTMPDKYGEYTEPEPDLVAIVDADEPEEAVDPNAETEHGRHAYDRPPDEMSDDWREVRARVGATRVAPRKAA